MLTSSHFGDIRRRRRRR